MRIWLLNHYAIPRDGTGPNSHAILAHYLQQSGHEVTLFPASIGLSNKQGPELPPGAIFTDHLDEGVRYRYVRTRPYRNTAGRLLNMLSYRKSVCRATAGLAAPDLIIGSCVHPWAVDAAMRLSRRYNAAFVYQIRDIWPETLVDMGLLRRWHPLYWYLRRLELRAFREADGVTGVLPGIRQYAGAHGVPPERVCYLPNGIDSSLYPEATPEPATEPFIVSYFGSHGPANDLWTVLNAAELLEREMGADRIRFRLVGDGADKQALVQRKEQLGLQNVEFVDRVPKSEIVRLANESHAFVFLLREFPVIERYGLSANKLFEYLMGARPIVFACRSLNNPVAEAQAGISIEPRDPAALAEAVVQLQSLSPNERALMGSRGRSYALANHDLSKLAVTFEQYLSMIAKECRRSRRSSPQKAYNLETECSSPSQGHT